MVALLCFKGLVKYNRSVLKQEWKVGHASKDKEYIGPIYRTGSSDLRVTRFLAV